MSRKLVLWMYAPDQPMWSAPEQTVADLRDTLQPEWRVTEIREPVHAMGDGAAHAPGVLSEEIVDAEVYCGFGLPREAFRRAEELCWIHTAAAGVSGILYPELRESDVILTNAAGVYAPPMAEHALAGILHFTRGLDLAVAARGRGEWARDRIAGEGSPVRELAGRCVGVVGYGGAGRAVGRRARALGLRVWGLRRRPSGEPPGEVERMLGPEALPELAREADYLVLCLPETPETRGLVDGEVLSALGPDGVLVNLARGEVVEEGALVRALEARTLRGAVLDVFREEPLPPSSPFWALENVLITPHVSGVSSRVWERQSELILENVRRYLDGQTLRNVVDKERGY